MDKLVPTSQPLLTYLSAALRYQGCEIDADASERIDPSWHDMYGDVFIKPE
jgi:hypothetical protein